MYIDWYLKAFMERKILIFDCGIRLCYLEFMGIILSQKEFREVCPIFSTILRVFSFLNYHIFGILISWQNINPILHGPFGGRERIGGAESAHPHENVLNPIYVMKSK